MDEDLPDKVDFTCCFADFDTHLYLNAVLSLSNESDVFMYYGQTP